MSHSAWSERVRLCVAIWVSCANTPEPIEMPFGGGANYYASRKPYVKRVVYTYGDCDVISFNIYASRIVSFSYRKFLGVMGSVKHKV